MRVHELAKQLGVSSKELLAKLHELGVGVGNNFSAVSEEAQAKAREAYKAAAPAAPAPAQPVPEAPAKKAPPPSAPVAKPVEAPPSTPPAEEKAPEKPVAPKLGIPHPAHEPRQPHKPADRRHEAARKPHGDKSHPASAPTPASAQAPAPSGPRKAITLRGAIIVRELAEQMGIRPNLLIAELMAMNIFASINQSVDLKIAQKVAEKHGFMIEHEKKLIEQKPPARKMEEEEPEEEKPEDLAPRSPIVTFMGHIDHGKTSLLDKIRNASVAKKEAGGITQHIGAYTIKHKGKGITFIDTPGHKAFTAMRARGANMTDICIIVVAADDGVMPQTEEAIKHAQAAKGTIMVALNKMDLPAANPDVVKRQLQSAGLAPEDWGGNVICCPVSAHTGEGIEHFLEMIQLQAEILELKANPKRKASGYVIESRMEPGMGPIATLMVMKGTLKVGDPLLCGPYWGRVKALINDHGVKVQSAGPATPVKCLGISGVPQAGEEFRVMSKDKAAKDLSEKRGDEDKLKQIVTPKKATLEQLLAATKDSSRPVELRVIIKCDTHGSMEAIQRELSEIKSEKVTLSILICAVGNITENDVLLASASNAIIIGFNVAKEPGVVAAEKREGVEIRMYAIIYQILDQMQQIMTGMLAPEIRERVIGTAEVRQLFPISKKGNVAGCLVQSGRIHVSCKIRVRRKGAIVFEGSVTTLKHFQESVNELREGQECGIRLGNFGSFEIGDLLEFVEIEKIPQKL